MTPSAQSYSRRAPVEVTCMVRCDPPQVPAATTAVGSFAQPGAARVIAMSTEANVLMLGWASDCWAALVVNSMMNCHTMPKTKVALTIDSELLERVDHLVARQRFRNRSQAVESALAEKLARLARTRLAEEAAKLDPAEERRLADEGLAEDGWPEY